MERNPSTRLRTYTMQQGQYAVSPIGRRRRTTIRRVRGGQRQSGVHREPSLRQQQRMSALNNRLSQLSGHSHHSHHSQQRPLSTLNSDDEQLEDGEEQVQPRQSTFQRRLSQAKKIISFLGGRYSVKLDSDNRDSQIEEGVDGDVAIGGSDDNNRDRGREGASFELIGTTIDNDRRTTNGAGDSGLPLPSKHVTILIPTDKDQDKLLTKLEPESQEDDKFANGYAGSEITTPGHSEDTVDGIGGLLVVSGGVVPAKVKSIAWEDKCVSTSDLEDYDEDNLYDDEDMLYDALTEIEERDYNNEVTFYPPPVFLLLISALEIGLFYTQDTRYKYGYRDSQLLYNPCKRQEAWPRYLTYIFAHRDEWHLFGNMVAQVCMGSMMELVHTWRIPIIYLGSAVGGCLMHSMIDGTQYVGGASGGVFGLIGARVADILLNFPEMRHVVFKYYGWCRCSCNYEAQRGGALVVFRRLIFGKFGQLLFALVCSSYAIYDFAAAIYSHVTNADNTTSYGAHLGGLIVGVLLGTLVLKNIHQEHWETILKHIARGALAFYVLFAVAWNIFYPHLLTANSKECAHYYNNTTDAPAALTDAEYQ